MTSLNKTLIITLAIITGFGVISCGPQKYSSSASSSSSQYTTTADKPLASCSHDVANNADISIRLQTYSSGGVESNNLVRVKFDRYPTSDNNMDSSVMFWAAYYDTYGVSHGLNATQFSIEIIDSSGLAHLSSIYTEITWSELKNYLQGFGISANSMQEAVGSVNFVIHVDGGNSTANYLQAATYAISSDTSPDHYVGALIPKFYANPADYAAGKPTVLKNLHPLNYMAGSNASAAQYTTAIQAFCIQ